MNELQLSNDLNVITAEINSYKQVAGQSIFEIGKRLKHVKENDLVHGEWMDWCKESLGFSSQQANKYIKVYDKFSNYELTSSFSVDALYLITSMNDEQLQNTHTIPSTGESKTVDEMTVRELKEVKQALKKVQNERDQLGKLLNEERNKQPIVKEVIPDRIKKQMEENEFKLTQFRKGYQEQKEKLQQYELNNSHEFDEEKAEAQKKKLQFEADYSTLELTVHVERFLQSASITAFRKGALASADNMTRKKLESSVESLEEFVSEVKRSLTGRIKI